MAVKEKRSFFPDGNRYKFDFSLCSITNGFAQVDTSQDAWYYGTWANPYTRTIVYYAEGDLIVMEAETDEEFVQELRVFKDWNDKTENRFKGIDTGYSYELRDAFVRIGAEEFLYLDLSIENSCLWF